MDYNRRRFLLGLGAAAGLLVVPRRYWVVGANAPVKASEDWEKFWDPKLGHTPKFGGEFTPKFFQDTQDDILKSLQGTEAWADFNEDQFDGLNAILNNYGRPTDMFVSSDVCDDLSRILNERPKVILSVKSTVPTAAVESIEREMSKIPFSSDFKPFRFTG